MKVLSIGLDRRLARSSSPLNESQHRQIAYAEKLEKLTIICKTPNRAEYQKIQLADNVTVLPSLSKRSWRFLLDAYKLGNQVLRNEPYDLITTQDPFYSGPTGYFLAHRHQIPLNIQLHSDFFNNPYWINERWLHFFLHPLGKLLIKRADSLRVVNHSTKEILVSFGVAKERIFVCPIGIETKNFRSPKNETRRNNYVQNEGEFLILSVGRLVAAKDYPTLLNTAHLVKEKIPGAKFVIVGDGREKNKLAALIREKTLESTVFIEDSVTYEDLPGYYAACDIFLLTSVYEGFGRVLVEASAAGKPLVSTFTAGAKEIIMPQKTGFLTSIGDAQSLADQIVHLLQNPQLRKNMGEAARQRAEDFSFSKTVDNLTAGWMSTQKR